MVKCLKSSCNFKKKLHRLQAEMQAKGEKTDDENKEDTIYLLLQYAVWYRKLTCV